MQRGIPIAATFIARVFDENIRRFQGVACGLIGQIGDTQMHRSDPRQGLIVRVQRCGDRRKSRHEPIDVQLLPIGAAEQMFELTPLSHHEACVASLDQQRAAQHQALLGAGEAEIVIAGVFTERQILGIIFVLLLGIYRFFILKCQLKSDNLLTSVAT
jgi:hypothetical protein